MKHALITISRTGKSWLLLGCNRPNQYGTKIDPSRIIATAPRDKTLGPAEKDAGWSALAAKAKELNLSLC